MIIASDVPGYELVTCSCSAGPYLCRQKPGSPTICHRCGFMVEEALEAILRPVRASALREAADKAAAIYRGNCGLRDGEIHMHSERCYQAGVVDGSSRERPTENEARAYRQARARLRLLFVTLAGRREEWANNTAQPCSSARAVTYQSAMQSVHSIIDEIEAIARGDR